jgi:hypothetical protein
MRLVNFCFHFIWIHHGHLGDELGRKWGKFVGQILQHEICMGKKKKVPSTKWVGIGRRASPHVLAVGRVIRTNWPTGQGMNESQIPIFSSTGEKRIEAGMEMEGFDITHCIEKSHSQWINGSIHLSSTSSPKKKKKLQRL